MSKYEGTFGIVNKLEKVLTFGQSCNADVYVFFLSALLYYFIHSTIFVIKMIHEQRIWSFQLMFWSNVMMAFLVAYGSFWEH